METSNRKKYWLSVGATIVLGALGSGLWSLVEPSASKAGNWILSVVTLGIQSIQDRVYASAALGLHELASLHIFLMASAFLFAAPGLLAATPWLRSMVRKLAKGKDALDEDNPSETERVRSFRLMLATTLFGTLSGSYFVIQFLMVNQENLIASFFRQRLTIVRPYISESDFNSYNSAFARIKSRDQYLALMDKLRVVGDANGIEMPKAETW